MKNSIKTFLGIILLFTVISCDLRKKIDEHKSWVKKINELSDGVDSDPMPRSEVSRGLQTIDSKKENPSKEEIAWNQRMDKIRLMSKEERIAFLRKEVDRKINLSFEELGIQDPALKGSIKSFEPNPQQNQDVHRVFDQGLRDFIQDENFLSLQQAKQRWGTHPFDPKAFSLDHELKYRSSMVADLIEKKIFLGKSLSELQEILGDADGIFLYDWIPTYYIENQKQFDPEEKKWKGELFELVFLTGQDQKITDVKIHY
ncbi:MAG: hypothetical protein R3A11_04755 [Bdellovibrionota bacterium]